MTERGVFMWNIGNAKRQSRLRMEQDFKRMFVAAILLVISEMGLNNARNLINFNNHLFLRITYFPRELGVVGLISILAFMALGFFLLNPLLVGVWKYYIRFNREAISDFGELKFGFERDRYKRVVKALFRRDLYLLFWGVLLIGVIEIPLEASRAYMIDHNLALLISIVLAIPLAIVLIVKSYSYMLVPMIIADNPEMEGEESIKLSVRLMDGNKGSYFIYQLSFMGWILLVWLAFVLLQFVVSRTILIILMYTALTVVTTYINGGTVEIYERLIDYEKEQEESSLKDVIDLQKTSDN